ncbi:MAG: substrate-binding domain-containing protein [Pseudomonadota bacterium]|nr:substrate-binding domain-containing protein [Pseudomonadota bacterium]
MKHLLLTATTALTLMASSLCSAQGLTFGVVAKSTSDRNFIAVQQGCEQAARSAGNHCELLGDDYESNPRYQQTAIRNALKSAGYDALGISVTRSDIIADALRGSSVPVIAYDSPFSPEYRHLSQAYVGPDNEEIGRLAAQVIQQQHPQGGTLCLMTSADDTNLNYRILGVRRQLSGDPRWPADKSLQGVNGWRENLRCPWYNGDDHERALQQIRITLEDPHNTVLIAVGSWPLKDLQAFRRQLTPYRHTLARHSLVIVTGIMTPEQQQLLNDGLATALISIDFNAMGQQLYQLLEQAATGQSAARDLRSPVHIIRPM